MPVENSILVILSGDSENLKKNIRPTTFLVVVRDHSYQEKVILVNTFVARRQTDFHTKSGVPTLPAHGAQNDNVRLNPLRVRDAEMSSAAKIEIYSMLKNKKQKQKQKQKNFELSTGGDFIGPI